MNLKIILLSIPISLICSLIIWLKKEDDVILHFEPTSPFAINFGRGTGLNGLDTISITEDGVATLHRLSDAETGIWQTTQITLSPQIVRKVAKSVDSNKILTLDNIYQDKSVKDRDQWILIIEQGQLQKVIYCNNKLSPKIVRFAKDIDAIMKEAGIEKAEWKNVAESESREHDVELWDTIKRQ